MELYQMPMDTTKPFGDACTPEGGLKEANQIAWINGPDDDCATTISKSAAIIRDVWVLTFIRQELPASAV
jgi:hypothetical protein